LIVVAPEIIGVIQKNQRFLVIGIERELTGGGVSTGKN
jgi:hypothetical protein